jgi:putative transposase
MKRKRFSEEQIIAVLKEGEGGVPVAEICRKHGISDATFYKWRAKFAGLEVSDAKRLRQLEEENRRLKLCWPIDSSANSPTREQQLGRRSLAQGGRGLKLESADRLLHG